MNNFPINLNVPVDIKVKSADPYNASWYLINIEHMMIHIGTNNDNATSSHDQIMYGQTYVLREIRGKLQYWDNCGTWFILEDLIQREYSNYIADRELLDGDEK